jgi:hypothetical protein
MSNTTRTRLLMGVLIATALASVAAPAMAQSPSPAVSAAPSASEAPVDTGPHDAPDLEAIFPDTIDGAPLVKGSLGAPTWEALGGLDAFAEVARIAEALNVDASAIEFGFANDPTATPLYNLFAIRVAGVTGDRIVDLYGTMAQEVEVDSVLQPDTLGSTDVMHLIAPNNPVGDVWFYALGDVLVGIQAGDELTAERLLGLLPTALPSPAASPPVASTTP